MPPWLARTQRGRDGDEQPGEATSQRGAVRLGHSEQLADDREWQREGERRDKIDPSVGCFGSEVVEQVVDDGLHSWPQRLNPARRKDGRHEAAESSVIRWVHAEHVARERWSRKPF